MSAPLRTLPWQLDFHGAELAAVDEEHLGKALGDLVVAWLAALRALPETPGVWHGLVSGPDPLVVRRTYVCTWPPLHDRRRIRSGSRAGAGWYWIPGGRGWRNLGHAGSSGMACGASL